MNGIDTMLGDIAGFLQRPTSHGALSLSYDGTQWVGAVHFGSEAQFGGDPELAAGAAYGMGPDLPGVLRQLCEQLGGVAMGEPRGST